MARTGWGPKARGKKLSSESVTSCNCDETKQKLWCSTNLDFSFTSLRRLIKVCKGVKEAEVKERTYGRGHGL